MWANATGNNRPNMRCTRRRPRRSRAAAGAGERQRWACEVKRRWSSCMGEGSSMKRWLRLPADEKYRIAKGVCRQVLE
jgi:hypothetical protein